MSIMDTTGKSSSDKQAISVNRFALFSETILAGVVVLLLSVPLVTVPAAYAAGVAHLERHLSGRDDSLRSLWGNFRRALPGSWKIGITTAAAAVVIVLNLVLALVGQLPGRVLILPATLILAAAAAVLLLRIAGNWSGGVVWAGDAGRKSVDLPGPQQQWRLAYSQAKADSFRDGSGSLLLLAAVFVAVVFVWMLQALFVIVPGMLILAAAAVKIRAASRTKN
ncbi:Poxvirus protein I5 [Paenarthrobacter sp. RAF54_2]|uniref:Poxvirus protein I5 n=1 Tax=Paenarthrobacter sp. RAF54_2 TaxID=3233061 RepID=UPI003F9AF807